MTWKKLAAYAGIALGIWFVIVEPVTAAHFVHGVGTLLSRTAHGISTFVSAL